MKDSRPRGVEGIVAELAALVRRDDELRLVGANEEILDAGRREIDRVRWELADAVRRSVVTGEPRAA